MSVSKKQQKSVNKYMKENYDRVVVMMPKGRLEIVKKAAATYGGQSVNGFINFCVNQMMAQTGFYVQPELQAAREMAEKQGASVFPLFETLPGLTKAEQDILFDGSQESGLLSREKSPGFFQWSMTLPPTKARMIKSTLRNRRTAQGFSFLPKR